MHAAYYSTREGFGVFFEAKVAREFAAFCEGFDASRDGMWFVVAAGRAEGSVIIDGSHAQRDGAHLRWFITSDAIRGHGFGERLLAEALAFADSCAYTRTYLWTFEGLLAARHLYEKHGFKLQTTAEGSQWGRTVNEQLFVRGEAGGAALDES
ncbi:MAG: GNAT family N-acetyltransferase [Aquincola sp.]|nr:GNAT family N-acetyltransferase [Aquincola sp.]